MIECGEASSKETGIDFKQALWAGLGNLIIKSTYSNKL